ncbi:MAG: SH3 domain-containing protein [Pseudomonadota bacterium]|nr:SH3 domain-containing protein [Pseudomonadota bacterium]
MTKKIITPIALFCATLFIPGTASALCVKVPEANLRQGPGIQHEKSWEVFKYMPFKKIGQQEKWFQVEDVDGDTHWIYSRLVTDAMQCAVVKVDNANVRSGPGTSFAKSPLSPVGKYYSFKIIESKGDWVKVRDEVFNDGWVAKWLLWAP